MIKLTLTSGNAWYVNPDKIISVGSQQNEAKTTYVETAVSDAVTDYVMTVQESPEEVVRKIMQHKRASVGFRCYYTGTVQQLVKSDMEVYESMVEDWDFLKELAGLED